MEKKGKILQLRKRLDKTLALPHLANEESIKSLIKNQLRLSSSSHIEEGEIEELAEKRSKEVSGFVEMLRSASETEMKAKGRDLSHSDWKIKQDTEQLRVMYREGPHGTPFHTLLSEGLADGPIDVCLCVSWETTLYIKWWPQFNWPTFKIIKSSCLEQVRVGEEISLIRVKVPWPVSDREALLHYFEIEYLEEDLIFVLIKTISDTKEHVEAKNGLSTDAVPEVVRIDLVGGLVLQKVDHCSSYFRVIANVDIKLDFVPPSLINFISRQLIGNGHKLFQKAVSTVATTDEDYQKALRKPMYARIREGVNSMNKAKACLVGLDEEKSNGILTVENIDKAAAGIQAVQEDTFVCEIVEEEAQHTTDSKSDVQNSQHTTNRNSKQQGSAEERAYISPEVDAALSILDNAISVLRKCGPFNILTEDCSPVEKFSGSEAPSGDLEVESPTGISRINRENSRTVDANSLHTNPAIFGSETVDLSSFHGKPVEDGFTMTKPPFVESINKVCDEGSLEANAFHKKGPSSVKLKHSRKKWLCCLSNAR